MAARCFRALSRLELERAAAGRARGIRAPAGSASIPRQNSTSFASSKRIRGASSAADDPIGQIIEANAREYGDLVEMLKARGTPRFYELSRRLYGSARDFFSDKKTRVRDVARDMYEILTNLDDAALGPQPERNILAERAVEMLNERLNAFFGDGRVRVMLDDGIVADAAAGGDYLKIRRGALFSERDVRVLEVHEGWTHLATSLNGQRQPVARWLAKGAPRTAAAQEGLAALLEVLTLVSHPSRARRLNDRVLAVDKAEDGASFLDVFEWFRTEGYDGGSLFLEYLPHFPRRRARRWGALHERHRLHEGHRCKITTS